VVKNLGHVILAHFTEIERQDNGTVILVGKALKYLEIAKEHTDTEHVRRCYVA